MLFAESGKGKETEEQTQTLRKDGFEPFVDPEPTQDPLFVNGYNGNFAQKMDLNRTGVERVLRIAHLEGQVFLTNLSLNRQRSVEANPDGSITKKRSLFFGEKIEDDKNPLRRVTPTPQGWKIEISDTGIREKLEEKKLSGRKLQTEFIKQFNGQLKQGILKCVLKEKLTGEKDEHFREKLFTTLFQPTLQLGILAIHLVPLNLRSIIIAIGVTETIYTFYNILYDFTRRLGSQIPRKIDHKLEYLMPQVEIDKVARSAAFLALKGETLVKEVS